MVTTILPLRNKFQCFGKGIQPGFQSRLLILTVILLKHLDLTKGNLIVLFQTFCFHLSLNCVLRCRHRLQGLL